MRDYGNARGKGYRSNSVYRSVTWADWDGDLRRSGIVTGVGGFAEPRHRVLF